MRYWVFFICFFGNLWAFSAQDVIISFSKDHLKLILRTQSKFSIQKKLNQVIVTLDDHFQENTWNKTLTHPFKSLQIHPISKEQTLIVLETYKNFSYSHSQDSQGLHLQIEISPEFSWWKYSMVLTVLLSLVIVLAFIKKKQNKRLSPHNFKINEFYLNKHSKITTLTNHEKSFVIFSNERGCVLLDSKNIKKDFELKEED